MNQPAKKRSGLGRGLASLIPTGPADGDPLGTKMGSAAADVLLGGPSAGTAPSAPPAAV